jgi:hypothetical protein
VLRGLSALFPSLAESAETGVLAAAHGHCRLSWGQGFMSNLD